MYIIYTVPIFAIIFLFLGFMGINLVSVLMWILKLLLALNIVAFIFSSKKKVMIILIVLNVLVLYFLNGKSLSMFNIFSALF